MIRQEIWLEVNFLFFHFQFSFLSPLADGKTNCSADHTFRELSISKKGECFGGLFPILFRKGWKSAKDSRRITLQGKLNSLFGIEINCVTLVPLLNQSVLHKVFHLYHVSSQRHAHTYPVLIQKLHDYRSMNHRKKLHWQSRTCHRWHSLYLISTTLALTV